MHVLVLLLAALLSAVTAQTDCLKTKYAQCGGEGFSGNTCCPIGMWCMTTNRYWAQCEPCSETSNAACDSTAPALPSPQPSPQPAADGKFELVDGGENRACRGASANDNDPSYYTYFNDIDTLTACQALCRSEPFCTGIEFGGNDCEVWTRPGGPQASTRVGGQICLRYSLLAAPAPSPTSTMPPNLPSQGRIICPFLGVMIQEGFLRVKEGYSREELFSLTLNAGLAQADAMDHMESNFKDIPSGMIDIFNMEGLPNEHKTSTGVHDCATFYHHCRPASGFFSCESEVDILDFQSCRADLPNSARFEEFWRVVDANGDDRLTKAELQAADGLFPVVDANPIASGDIVGSHSFILDMFGQNGEITKQDLQLVFLERRSPSYYSFDESISLFQLENARAKTHKFLRPVKQANLGTSWLQINGTPTRVLHAGAECFK